MDNRKETIEKQFREWVAQKVSSRQFSDIFSNLRDIETYCRKRNIIDKPIFEIAKLQTIVRLKNTVDSNKTFKLNNRKSLAKMQFAMKLFYSFVSNNQYLYTSTDASENTAEVINVDTYKKCYGPTMKSDPKPDNSSMTLTETDEMLYRKYPVAYRQIFELFKSNFDKGGKGFTSVEVSSKISYKDHSIEIDKILKYSSWLKQVDGIYMFSADLQAVEKEGVSERLTSEDLNKVQFINSENNEADKNSSSEISNNSAETTDNNIVKTVLSDSYTDTYKTLLIHNPRNEIETNFRHSLKGKLPSATIEDIVDLLLELNDYCFKNKLFNSLKSSKISVELVSLFRTVLSSADDFRNEHKFELSRMANACNRLNEYCLNNVENNRLNFEDIKIKAQEHSVDCSNNENVIVIDLDIADDVVDKQHTNVIADNAATTTNKESDFEINVIDQFTRENDLHWEAREIAIDFNNQQDQEHFGSIDLIPFRKRFNIDYDFQDISISYLDLSNKESNCLKRSNITSINELLEINAEQLKNIRGLGSGTYNSLLQKIEFLDVQKIIDKYEEAGICEQAVVGKESLSLRERFNVQGDFSCILLKDLNLPHRAFASLRRSGIYDLQTLLCLSETRISSIRSMGTASVGAILTVLADYFSNPINYISHEENTPLKDSISNDDDITSSDNDEMFNDTLRIVKRKIGTLRIIPFLVAFETKNTMAEYWLNDDFFKESGLKYINDLDIHSDLYEQFDITKSGVYQQFLFWLNFDLDKIIKSQLTKIRKIDQKLLDILRLRNDGKTLAEVGELFGVSRQMISQNENKAISKLANVLNDKNDYDLISLIYAIRGGDSVLQKSEVEGHIGSDLTAIYWLYYQNIEERRKTYYFDKKIGCFVFDIAVNKEGVNAIDITSTLPDFIVDNELNSVVKSIIDNYGVTKEFVMLQIDDIYTHSGIIRHKGRLKRGFCIDFIIKYAFKQGFKIGDTDNYNKVRQLFLEYFNIDANDYSDHAIDARIAECGILCDRGTYIHRDNISFDKNIAKKIITYVNRHEETEIAFSEVFDDLEDDMLKAGIRNRYMLLGVIKDLELPFENNRDYIYKSENIELATFDEINEIELSKDPLEDNIKKVIATVFPNGYKLDSNIQYKKFCMSYAGLYGFEFSYAKEKLNRVLRSVGIENGGVVVLPELLMSDSLANEILAFVENYFAKGRKFVFYSVIIDNFNEVINPILRNVDFFRMALVKYCSLFNKNYSLTMRCIAENIRVDISVKREVENVLLNAGAPIGREDIYSVLSNIPNSKVDEVLSKPQIRTNATGVFYHIDILELNPEDIEIIKGLISDYLKEEEYLTTTELVELLKSKAKLIMPKLEGLSDLGIKNAIAYYLYSYFKFNGNVISSNSQQLNSEKIFRAFVQKHDNCTLADFVQIRNELGCNINFEVIFEKLLRVNRTDYVSLSNACFDVQATDAAIDDFCIGDFISIYDVKYFGTFPDAGYRWNEFLLEQYVYKFSKKYKLIHDRFNEASCVGAIVKCDASGLNEYKDVLAMSVAKSDIELNRINTLNYLKEAGFITSTRFGAVEQIIEKARIIRQKESE